MTKEPNPYQVPTLPEPLSASTPGPSTWGRNILSLLIIAPVYSILNLSFSTSVTLVPLAGFLLFTSSLLASTWSNFHVASRIGWRQGGIHIMSILDFGWTMTYFVLAITGATMLESVVHTR